MRLEIKAEINGKTVSVAYYNEVIVNSPGTNIEIDFASNKPNYGKSY